MKSNQFEKSYLFLFMLRKAIGSMINIYREGVSNELKSKKLHVLPNIECVKNVERFPNDGEFCAGNLGNINLNAIFK